MSPSPLLLHQRVLKTIAFAIDSFVIQHQSGECIISPIDVFLDNKNIVQPDIVFIAKENLSIIKQDRIKGAPDLIIEILSPGSESHDLETKKELCERFGIKEYFIVDPKTKETIHYLWENGKFIQQPSDKSTISSKLLQKPFSF